MNMLCYLEVALSNSINRNILFKGTQFNMILIDFFALHL